MVERRSAAPQREIPELDAGGLQRTQWTCALKDGTLVTVRLLSCDDLDACAEFFACCSPRSLYSRYERVPRESPFQLAKQLCYPSEDGCMTVVGEARIDGVERVLGVAQLLSDPDHAVAEFAVLVADPWQGRGLGSAFTDRVVDCARALGIQRIVAEFLPENVRLIRIVESRAFRLHRDCGGQAVAAEKTLAVGDAAD
jgi:acetyltransferase